MKYLIAHAGWDPKRKIPLQRLTRNLLDQLEDSPADHHYQVVESKGPEHAAIWSRRLWEKAARQDDHVCLLNDDVILAPDFVEIISRAVAAVPDEPISLHCTNPNAVAIEGAWARCYHYSGPAVILPPGAAKSLCEYVYTLPWSMVSRMNEDNLANEWAWSRQRPFWYLLPAPVTHDTGVPSTLGYDNHPHRTPTVLGPERDPTVTDRDAVPFIELDWCLVKGLNYRRLVIQAGRHLCTFCVSREGVVGNAQVKACLPCLAELGNTVERGR